MLLLRDLLADVTQNEYWRDGVLDDVPLVECGVDSLHAMALKHRFFSCVKEMDHEKRRRREEGEEDRGEGEKKEGVVWDEQRMSWEFALFDTVTLSTLAEEAERISSPSTHCSASLSNPTNPLTLPHPSKAVTERDKRLPKAKSPLRSGGITFCASGDLEGLKVFIQRNQWDAQYFVDKNGSTGLHWAAGNGHLQIVEFLLVSEMLPVDVEDEMGRYPLPSSSIKRVFLFQPPLN